MKQLPEIFTDLGNMIRQRRIELNLSQDELAWRCSLHLNAIWKIENAKSEIKFSTLIKIFDELNLSLVKIEELRQKHKE